MLFSRTLYLHTIILPWHFYHALSLHFSDIFKILGQLARLIHFWSHFLDILGQFLLLSSSLSQRGIFAYKLLLSCLCSILAIFRACLLSRGKKRMSTFMRRAKWTINVFVDLFPSQLFFPPNWKCKQKKENSPRHGKKSEWEKPNHLVEKRTSKTWILDYIQSI